MKKHGAIALLLILSLCLTITPALAQENNSGVSNLKAVIISPFQVKVTWDSPDSAFRVFYQPVKGNLYYFVDVNTNSALIYLAPLTDYMIWVQPEGKEVSETVNISTPKASTQKEYGYRFREFSFYTTTGGPELNFFEDSSRVRVNKVQGALMAGAGEARDYYMLTEFNMSHASQDRNMHYMLVMTPPNSFERLLDHGDLTLPGHWTDINYAFVLNKLIYSHTNYLGEMSPGKYSIDLIINGWHAGGAELIVE